mmetsp:Transcript_36996/g.66565  ORF Transcript_36996/g.66565 Transcript_36996/m.66565 type:complete len:87 (+) Transcript_36996:388-648(+)
MWLMFSLRKKCTRRRFLWNRRSNKKTGGGMERQVGDMLRSIKMVNSTPCKIFGCDKKVEFAISKKSETDYYRYLSSDIIFEWVVSI